MKAIIEAFERNDVRLRGRESFRIFHGRGGAYPDCVDSRWCNIDFFHPLILVTLYREPSWETGLKEFLAQQAEKFSLQNVLIQRRYLPHSPTETINNADLPTEPVYARRGNLLFKLSFSQQNCGFFLDIEPARQWLEQICRGKKILNLFSYTCTFSVIAMNAGAASVVNMDLSSRSLGIGQHNHRCNQINTEQVRFLPHDIFKSWGKLNRLGPFDIVVIDPPSYQKGSFIARRDYPKVAGRMDGLLNSDGCFLACLNAPEIGVGEFEHLIGSATEDFVLHHRLPASPDFPDKDESALKMLVYKRKV